MTVHELLKKRLVLISGKGGVGKSTLCAAVAHLAGTMGKRVLLVESSFEPVLPVLFDQPSENFSGYEAREVGEGVFHLNLVFSAVVKDFFGYYLGKNLASRVLGSEMLASFLSVLPGVEETIILGKIAQVVSDSVEGLSDYDLVVFDMPSTGHAVQFLETPKVLMSIINKGFIFEKANKISTVLHDPSITTIKLVALPESTVISETKDLFDSIKTKLEMPVDTIFVNQIESLDIQAPDIENMRTFRNLLQEKKMMSKQENAFYNDLLALMGYEGKVIAEQQACLDHLDGLQLAPIVRVKRMHRANSGLNLLDRIRSDLIAMMG